jgi:hypothetical protein
MTPGPWSLTFDRTGVLALSKKGTWIKVAESLPVQLVDGTGDHSLTPGEVEANAQLIACAPELYEMLEKINAAFYTRTSRKEWLELMEETKPLLRKARGE